MKQTFDTDSTLFDILKDYTPLNTTLTGGIYTGERPDGSDLEDVVVNTITLTQEADPQRGVSNVNIHVSDIDVIIRGATQKKANRARLKALTTLVTTALRAANVSGLEFWITNQALVKEAEISQHFVNLRIEWNIHN